MQFFPLLRTKLYRPRTTRELVGRPRVRDLLDCAPDPSLTLVCAPAGFGKTTILNDWLENCSSPNAWLSLDERDSDLGIFLAYFIAAVRTLFPSACAGTEQLLRAPALPPLARLVTALGNDLDCLGDDPTPIVEGARILKDAPDDERSSGNGHPGFGDGGRFIVVLDDYHALKGREVHTFLSELLAHPPRPLHLVICTRQEPPLPLYALRAQGKMTEIRAKDLRFTPDEVGAFMEHSLGVRLGQAAVATLAERTEGWATGLRLAALSISAGANLIDPEVPVLTEDRYALDYLLNEVLDKVPLATQQFLLKTSILERLSGPLCDAVVGPAVPGWDGQAYLDWLVRENVFTFTLDDEGTWFRYHHLFLKLLRSQMERQYALEDIEELHWLASSWFADNGLIDEAIEHALVSGDDLLAVRLLEANRYQAMDQEQWRRLEHWLSLFPSRLIDSQPELLLLEAWILQKQWRFTDLAPCLNRIEALLGRALPAESRYTRPRAELDVLQCVLSYYVGEAEQTSRHAESALEGTSGDCSFVRGTAWFYQAGARQMKGDLQGALEVLQSGLEENRLRCNRLPMRLYTGLSIVYWNSTDLQNLLRVADQFRLASEQHDLAEATCWAYYFQGCALYQMNDLSGAEAAFSEVVARRYLAHGFAFSQSAFGLASIHLARGESKRAREMVDSVGTYALEISNSRIAA
ncbi:MAG: hypothetical protein ACM30E_04960, partial [Nitrososphaerales archaeon]